MQSAPLKERVHVAVEVLDARVHEHVRRGHEVTGRPGEHVVRVHWIEAAGDRPREDSSREIVDDRVNVRLRAIEQLDDRHVDVPGLVRGMGALKWTPNFGPGVKVVRGACSKPERSRSDEEYP